MKTNYGYEHLFLKSHVTKHEVVYFKLFIFQMLSTHLHGGIFILIPGIIQPGGLYAKEIL
jgi:hypothetical protein